MYQATEVLLEFAIEFMVGTFTEPALRAAEVLFHRATGATSQMRPLGSAAFNAELDADWLKTIAAAKRARPLTNTEAESIVQQMRTRKDGAA